MSKGTPVIAAGKPAEKRSRQGDLRKSDCGRETCGKAIAAGKPAEKTIAAGKPAGKNNRGRETCGKNDCGRETCGKKKMKTEKNPVPAELLLKETLPKRDFVFFISAGKEKIMRRKSDEPYAPAKRTNMCRQSGAF